MASGPSARQTARRSPWCTPNATAKSQPIPGLRPWSAPNDSSAPAAAHTFVDIARSREAEGVRRCVAALQPHLVRPHSLLELDEEVLIEREAAGASHVELREPAADAVRVELRVPRTIERIGQVDAPPIAAHLDHLRAAVERL